MEKIVISGAGLVGSFWALYLKSLGYDVELYEKRDDMRKDLEGAGRSINLIATSRALNAFTAAGIIDEMRSIFVPVTGRMMHSLEGELTYQPYGRDDSECNYSVSRSLLNITLMNAAEKAGVKIFFNKELKNLKPDEGVADFSGTNVSFDRFFGADGAGSPTRKALLRLMPESTESVDFIDADYKELLMPATLNGDYPMEKKALHIWPRGDHMFMALPNLAGSFTMTLYLPRESKSGPSFNDLKTPEDVLSFFNEYYQGSVSLMPGFEKEFFENPQGRLGTVKMSNWVYKDKVALIGDSAHAIVPFFGQGMNCGMEDCFYLLSLMKNFGDDWAKVFEEYDRLQRPNGNAIGDMALENFVEMKDKVGDSRFLLKKAVEHKIETTFPQKYRARYGMVTYTLIPYHQAFEAGLIQNKILDELIDGIESIEDLDLKKAESLIDEHFLPFINEKGIDLSRYIEGSTPIFKLS